MSDIEKKIDLYRARADRAFHNRPVDTFLRETKAIIGAANMPPTETGRLAEEALEALNNMQMPTPKQLSALEMLIRLMRPAPLSVGGQLEEIDPQMLPEFEEWPDFKEKVRPFLYSIGRINLPPNKGIGTGFLISENVLVTNRHVLDLISHGFGVVEKGQATVNFCSEFGVTDDLQKRANILAARAVHPTLDIALLEIEAQTFDANRQPLTIGAAQADIEEQSVATVGYPFEDAFSPYFANAVFGGRFGVKRAAVGEILQVKPDSVYHDCSTLNGNSGSPLFSLKDATVIGVHRDGHFLFRNEAVNSEAVRSFFEESK